MSKIFIGIDPDLDKSGYCSMNGKEVVELTTLEFFQMIEKIKTLADFADNNNLSIQVIIEAGWLNATKSYHAAINKSVAARIGANVGENHATGKLLEQAMLFYGIPYKLVKPTTAKWNADFFKQVTKLTRRTNQEERDALKLVWGL